jgi:flavodoxin
VLLAYFSRAGENYYYGDRIDLEVGNTEVLAGMLKQLTGCDVYRIEEADPYPDSYDATRERNLEEQRANARPAIAKALPSIERYDTVLLASGIWGNRAPMIMTTFAEGLDFIGKTIHPVTTYAVSGLGSTERDYAGSCPGADVGEGFAVRGEETEDAGGYRTRALVPQRGPRSIFAPRRRDRSGRSHRHRNARRGSRAGGRASHRPRPGYSLTAGAGGCPVSNAET